MHPSPPLPLTRELVLIGGGHAHALVLRMWGMKPLPGVRVTVINPEPVAPYTGMLPGAKTWISTWCGWRVLRARD